MSGIHRILVPIDFSSCSEQALERAVELAERYFGASIDVLHVWEPPRSQDDSMPISSTNGGQAALRHAAMVEALKAMEALLAEHDAKGVVKFARLHECGETVPTILEIARGGEYSLIVMGTHGRTGMAQEYLGSVAEKVVRRARCPVLTVREWDEEHAPQKATAVVETAAR